MSNFQTSPSGGSFVVSAIVALETSPYWLEPLIVTSYAVSGSKLGILIEVFPVDSVTAYDVTINGSSQYGDVSSATMALTTNEPPEGEVWKLDISAKMAVLGTQLIEVFPVDSV
jgi:hypothetical protein